MTVTLPALTTTVERITIQRAMALILAGSKTRACPIGINQNGPGSDILAVHWAGFVGLYQWTDFFGIEAQSVRRRVDGPLISASGSADWNGWHVQLSAIEPVAKLDAETAALIDEVTADAPLCFWRGCGEPQVPPFAYCGEHYVPPCASCGGEMTHRAGCPAEAPECVDCSMPGGHQESCAFASRVDPEAAAQIPVAVFEVSPNPAPAVDISDLIADIDEPVPYTPFDPDAREYVPTCFDEPTVQLPHPGVHYVPEGVHPRGREPHEPTDHGVPIVDVLTVDPELDVIERDDNAVMGRVLPPQMLFAEAADRLADAMLGEASGE